MKKQIIAAALAFAACQAWGAPDLKEILSGITGKGQTEQTQEPKTEEPSKKNSGGLGGLIDGVTSIGNKLGIIPSKAVDIKYLQGEWKYKKPAVAFQSDNFLAKAGGVAASAKVESEMEPYYKKLGLNKTELTVDSAGNFNMKIGMMPLKGKIESKDSKLIFNFQVAGLKIGKVSAYVNAETASKMAITFDVSGLLKVVEAVAKFGNTTSLKALSAILKNYDGMTAGFYMEKKSK